MAKIMVCDHYCKNCMYNNCIEGKSDAAEAIELNEKLQKRDEYIAKLHRAIMMAYRYNQETAGHYKDAAEDTDDVVDKAEFLCKANGILEANVNIRNFLGEIMDMAVI